VIANKKLKQCSNNNNNNNSMHKIGLTYGEDGRVLSLPAAVHGSAALQRNLAAREFRRRHDPHSAPLALSDFSYLSLFFLTVGIDGKYKVVKIEIIKIIQKFLTCQYSILNQRRWRAQSRGGQHL